MAKKIEFSLKEMATVNGMVSGEIKALEERLNYFKEIDTFDEEGGFSSSIEDSIVYHIKFFKKLLDKVSCNENLCKVKLTKEERTTIEGMVSGEVKKYEERLAYYEKIDMYDECGGMNKEIEARIVDNIKHYKKVLKKLYIED